MTILDVLQALWFGLSLALITYTLGQGLDRWIEAFDRLRTQRRRDALAAQAQAREAAKRVRASWRV